MLNTGERRGPTRRRSLLSVVSQKRPRPCFRRGCHKTLITRSEAAMKQDPYNHMGWRERAASHLDGLRFALFFLFPTYFPSSFFLIRLPSFFLYSFPFLRPSFPTCSSFDSFLFFVCIILLWFVPFIICSGLSLSFECVPQSTPKSWVKLQLRKPARAPGLAAKHRAL